LFAFTVAIALGMQTQNRLAQAQTWDASAAQRDTAVSGETVYAVRPFQDLAPPPLPPESPSWSPVAHFGGISRQRNERSK
jgi:hypothetical protein